MIPAAGLGTRLRPWTLYHPKALVEVEGQPMLHRVITHLISEGATEIVVNTHHFANQIIEYLHTHTFPIPIKVSDESDLLLDTGGGLRKALGLFSTSGPVMVHNADILSTAPLRKIFQNHVTSQHDITLAVSTRPSTRRLLFDHTNRLHGWTNTSSGEIKPAGLEVAGLASAAFSGIYVIGEKAAGVLNNFMPDSTPFPIMDFLLSKAESLHIHGYQVEGMKILDIGKPETLAKASEFLMQNGLNHL